MKNLRFSNLNLSLIILFTVALWSLPALSMNRVGHLAAIESGEYAKSLADLQQIQTDGQTANKALLIAMGAKLGLPAGQKPTIENIMAALQAKVPVVAPTPVAAPATAPVVPVATPVPVAPMSAPAVPTSAVVSPAAPVVSPVSGGGSGSVSGRSVRVGSDSSSVKSSLSAKEESASSVGEKGALTPFNIDFYKTDIENLANLYQDYDIAIQAFNTEQSSGWGSIFGKSAKEKLADLQSEHEQKINAVESALKKQLAASEDMQVKRMQKIYKQILKEYYGVENNEKDISKILAKPGAKKIVTDNFRFEFHNPIK